MVRAHSNKIGRFQVASRLGKDGQGTVYLAKDPYMARVFEAFAHVGVLTASCANLIISSISLNTTSSFSIFITTSAAPP